MGALSPTHWLIIAGVMVLLFGAKKLPDFARSMGQSARSTSSSPMLLIVLGTTQRPYEHRLQVP